MSVILTGLSIKTRYKRELQEDSVSLFSYGYFVDVLCFLGEGYRPMCTGNAVFLFERGAKPKHKVSLYLLMFTQNVSRPHETASTAEFDVLPVLTGCLVHHVAFHLHITTYTNLPDSVMCH